MTDLTPLPTDPIFTDEDAAEQWLAEARWPDGVRCPNCSSDRVNRDSARRLPYRCLKCRRFFSVTTGTALHSSNLDYRRLVIAFNLLTLPEFGYSLDDLHLDMDTSRKAAWNIAHRVSEIWSENQ